ncbi:MAG: serine hydroxymethyltransferase [Rhodospirillales bacterium]|nr:serine hydroxymethyltransferase [Rhodospirillales bacterium]MCY4004544.1 serine hydroxymethyltransferase [Rhodospirillales bacterium]
MLADDPEVRAGLNLELERQRDTIELIASENFTSSAVLAAQGSVLTNKYAEGYPGHRYYGGCAAVDVVEDLAIRRARELFRCVHVNVQPHSGSAANQAAFLALIKPGDTVLGMSLAAGGHLTHGNAPNLSGRWFRTAFYGLGSDDRIDYDEVAKRAAEARPQLIIAGASAYSRAIDFGRFREIADSVDAFLLADVAHYAGLIAVDRYPSPLPHAHIVSTTTHKTLRGPRGGMLLTNDADMGKRIDRALFPGLQGGPLMHVIAAKAVAFGEALQPDFRTYIDQVCANAAALARVLLARGFDIVSGGTDTHMVLVDLRRHDVTGRDAEHALERAGLTCNKNAVPKDPRPPLVTSGIRLGSPAATTRGFAVPEFETIGHLIADVLDGLRSNGSNEDANAAVEVEVRRNVGELTRRFPLYPELGTELSGEL